MPDPVLAAAREALSEDACSFQGSLKSCVRVGRFLDGTAVPFSRFRHGVHTLASCADLCRPRLVQSLGDATELSRQAGNQQGAARLVVQMTPSSYRSTGKRPPLKNTACPQQGTHSFLQVLDCLLMPRKLNFPPSSFL